MALTFGPEHLGVTPRTVSDVTVRSLPSGEPADLVDGINLDAFGTVSFSVTEAGRYSIRVTDGSAVAVRTVILSDLQPYDITDPRSYANFAPSVGEGVPGGGGGGGGVTDHGDLTGLGDDDHPQYLNQARADARYATSAEVDQLENNFDGFLDAFPNHTHTASQISDASTVGRSVLTANTTADARDAIGAKSASYTPAIYDLPAGSVLFANQNRFSGTWPDRPTNRTDLQVIWTGEAPGPGIASYPAVDGAYEGDIINLIGE